MRSGAIFFDVDGVLIDSLPAHLAICRDKAKEFGLDLVVPPIRDFRALIARGIKISPMYHFFHAVGFPDECARRAVEDYDRDFARLYRPPLFRHAEKMLALLSDNRWDLGIVTSNIAANIFPTLGEALSYFDPRCVFTLDRFGSRPPKDWCLTEGARILERSPSDCLYVGDLPSDAVAADAAGFRFLGVTYGWGIERGTIGTVDRIEDIPHFVSTSVC